MTPFTERFVRCGRHQVDVLVVVWEHAFPTGRMQPPVNGISVSEFGPAWAAVCTADKHHSICEPVTTDLDLFVTMANERWA